LNVKVYYNGIAGKPFAFGSSFDVVGYIEEG